MEFYLLDIFFELCIVSTLTSPGSIVVFLCWSLKYFESFVTHSCLYQYLPEKLLPYAVCRSALCTQESYKRIDRSWLNLSAHWNSMNPTMETHNVVFLCGPLWQSKAEIIVLWEASRGGDFELSGELRGRLTVPGTVSFSHTFCTATGAFRSVRARVFYALQITECFLLWRWVKEHTLFHLVWCTD